MFPLPVSLLIYMLVSLCLAFYLAEERDRPFLMGRVLLAWFALGFLTGLINLWLPFTGEGDDFAYFDLSSLATNSLMEIFSPGRFSDVMEQPGYLLLLSLANLLTSSDLLAFKLLNLLFLISLALIWYRIALLLESPDFGRSVFMSILCLTPLWFYVFFLLKDMTIVLLQSLFLLGLVRNWRNNSLGSWMFLGVVTLALLPFRTYLVVQNLVVLLAAVAVKTFGREFGSRTGPLVLTIALVGGLLAISSNSSVLAEIGVFTEHRVIGTREMFETVSGARDTSEMNRALFPLLYLFSETAGLSSQSWESFDFAWLRGILAVPWIFSVVPFFLLGVFWISKAPPGISVRTGLLSRMRDSRFVTTPWGVLMIFVLSTMAISWIAGDTTRWRIQDMPVIATIAMAGWAFGARRIRQTVLTGWVVGGGALFLLFYLLKGF